MQKYKIIDKKVGETPLQALENFRQTDPRLAGQPLTYAGRLDPMAKGKLLVLIGEECKNRKHYDGLDKEYEVEVLFGIKTDSGDVLGKILSKDFDFKTDSREVVKNAKTFLGERHVPYPNFSSKPVDGKPMFQHTVLENLENIEIPLSKMHIKRIDFLDLKSITFSEIQKTALIKINALQSGELDSRVGSGFRKDEIILDWNNLDIEGSKEFQIAKFRIVSASGGYMRTFAEMLAEKFGTVGFAFSISRTQIGKYFKISKNFGFWIRRY